MTLHQPTPRGTVGKPVDEENQVNTDRLHALDAWLRCVDSLLGEADALVLADTTQAEEGPELIGKLWVRLHKERDLELHVRVGWLAGTEFVQLIDFVPSTGRYDTSVMVEPHLLARLLAELVAIHRHSGGTAENFGDDQVVGVPALHRRRIQSLAQVAGG